MSWLLSKGTLNQKKEEKGYQWATKERLRAFFPLSVTRKGDLKAVEDKHEDYSHLLGRKAGHRLRAKKRFRIELPTSLWVLEKARVCRGRVQASPGC